MKKNVDFQDQLLSLGITHLAQGLPGMNNIFDKLLIKPVAIISHALRPKAWPDF